MFKEIIIGPNFIGKTTIANYLKTNPALRVAELDEMILIDNGGVWPQDRSQIGAMIPRLIDTVISQENMIFFTGYINPEQIILAKRNGFRIVQLFLNLEDLKKRNIFHDLVREADMIENLKYQKEIEEMVDVRIKADKSIEEIAQLIIKK